MKRQLILIPVLVLLLFVGMSTIMGGKYSITHYYAKVKTIIQDRKAAQDLQSPKLLTSYTPKNHWRGEHGLFALLIDTTHTYKAAKTTSKKHRKLYKSTRVRILHEAKKPELIDDTPIYWVFVSDEKNSRQLGWLPKEALVFPHQFTKVTQIDKSSIDYIKGQFSAKMDIKENGRFTMYWKASGEGLFLKGQEHGQLYDYDDIIWAKKDKQDYIHHFFIIDQNENFSQEKRFELDTISTNRYTLPE